MFVQQAFFPCIPFFLWFIINIFGHHLWVITFLTSAVMEEGRNRRFLRETTDKRITLSDGFFMCLMEKWKNSKAPKRN